MPGPLLANTVSTMIVDVILPCLNEAPALPWILDRMPAGFRPIVIDNCSTDGSGEVARSLGATVVPPARASGQPPTPACWRRQPTSCASATVTGASTRGSSPPYPATAAGRADLVLGRRRTLQRDAWPVAARLANWELARRVRRRTGLAIRDLGPMRAASREALLGLNLADRRFGYPLEMVMNAAAAGWRVCEVDVTYLPAYRKVQGDGHPGRLRAHRAGHEPGTRPMTSPAPESATTLLVIAKQPVPGRVKTRLVPPCTHEQAAALAEAALADTLHTVLSVPACRRVLVLDGSPGPWLPPGFDILPQRGGPPDERLADAFAAAGGPALLIGMDTPQVTRGLLTVDWSTADAVSVRPTTAGSGRSACTYPIPPYCAASPCRPRAPGPSSGARLQPAGLRVADLPRLRDVDTAADAVAVARQVPRSRFAARARELAAVLSEGDSILRETA